MYYWYHLFRHLNQITALFYVWKLAQKYIVDAYVIIDQQCLEWIKHHQNQICADLYNCVTDFLCTDDLDQGPSGQKVVLPVSYTEGDWHMLTLYQNFMTIIQHFGKPTLFMTMTVNPKWFEIINALPSEMTAQNNSALITTVFILKKKTLLTDLKTQFDTYQSISWTVEYQKHRLSHCHILLFLTAQDHTLDSGWIDNYI